MKIVRIKGGLGNQLFQVAFAYLLKKCTNEEVKLDLSSYEKIVDDPIRKPRILKMNISIPTATEDDLRSICLFKQIGSSPINYKINVALESVLNKKYFFEKNRAYINPYSILHYQYFNGYWQSWRYVEPIMDIINAHFKPNYKIDEKTTELIKKVSNTNSVFIGIRRGDYLEEKKHYGSYENSYYQFAMNYITSQIENPTFYVFSNDIPWVKQNINFERRNVIYREPNEIVDDFEDFLIMASCSHSIIINSTFHWWAARLNDRPNKIVIVPDKWFFDNKTIDIIPPNWKRIKI